MTEDNEKRICVGINPVIELLKTDTVIDRIYIANGKNSPQIKRIISEAKKKGVPVIFTHISSLDKMSDGASHQGVAALCAEKEYCEVEDILEYAKSKNEKPFIIILDEIKDPHNLGAIIRSADGCGAHGIIVPKRNSAPLTQVVAKTAAGALENARIARVSNLTATVEELKKDGVWVFGAADQGAQNYTECDFDCPMALIIGDEGFGIGRLLMSKCDFLIKIPMLGAVSSLNASVAAGVLMYEALRQRKIQNGGKQ